VPEKIVVLSLLVAMKFAAVPLVAIVLLAIAEKVTVPDANDPAGGALKLLVVNVVLLELRNISRAVAFVDPAARRLMIASPTAFLVAVSTIAIVIFFYFIFTL
jgi:hypothetical protein